MQVNKHKILLSNRSLKYDFTERKVQANHFCIKGQ